MAGVSGGPRSTGIACSPVRLKTLEIASTGSAEAPPRARSRTRRSDEIDAVRPCRLEPSTPSLPLVLPGHRIDLRLQASCKHLASAGMSPCSAEMHGRGRQLARCLHFGGKRRNACTQSRRLITRRSQVQILPPLLRKAPETAPFALSSAADFSLLQTPSAHRRPNCPSSGNVARCRRHAATAPSDPEISLPSLRPTSAGTFGVPAGARANRALPMRAYERRACGRGRRARRRIEQPPSEL